MKKQIALILALIWLNIQSLTAQSLLQGLLLTNPPKASLSSSDTTAIKKIDTLQVILTGNKEIDAELKRAVEKYWTFNKIKYVNTDKFPELKLTLGRYTLKDARAVTLNPRSYTRMVLTFRPKGYMSYDGDDGFQIYDLWFDDMMEKDEKTNGDSIKGIDRNIDFIKARIATYVMIMNFELKKRINNPKEYYRDPIAKLKNKTVLVQSEYFSNDIKASVLYELPFKTEIKSTVEIKNIFDNAKGNENFAQMVFFQIDPGSTRVFIVDLSTGEILYYFGGARGHCYPSLCKEAYEHLLKNLKKRCVKEFEKSK